MLFCLKYFSLCALFELCGKIPYAMSDPITQKIIGAAIEVHRHLGPGLIESIYEAALCHEFELNGISFKQQVDLDVIYKDVVFKGQRVDLVVEDAVVVEIKSLSRLPEVATAQVLSYLKATGLSRGLLINFGAKRLVEGLKRNSL
jgi:GxxExxY protein